MNTYAAQRIRFGILAARHMLERGRLTVGQVEDLEGMRESGWKYQDALNSFDAEFESASERALGARPHSALRAQFRKSDRKRGRRRANR